MKPGEAAYLAWVESRTQWLPATERPTPDSFVDLNPLDQKAWHDAARAAIDHFVLNVPVRGISSEERSRFWIDVYLQAMKEEIGPSPGSAADVALDLLDMRFGGGRQT